ncbi:hypothetical protein Nmel_003695 [Mimus melanotis]
MVIWVYRQPQLKPLWLLLVPGQTAGGCHLLCSQYGGSGLEVMLSWSSSPRAV